MLLASNIRFRTLILNASKYLLNPPKIRGPCCFLVNSPHVKALWIPQHLGARNSLACTARWLWLASWWPCRRCWYLGVGVCLSGSELAFWWYSTFFWSNQGSFVGGWCCTFHITVAAIVSTQTHCSANEWPSGPRILMRDRLLTPNLWFWEARLSSVGFSPAKSYRCFRESRQ